MAKWYNNDDFLLHRLKADDEKALEFLFRQHYAALFRVSFRVVGNAESAKDIIQDVFATLWEKRHSLNVSKSVKAYLFRAVANRSINYVRDNPSTQTASIESVRQERHSTSFNDAGDKLEERELQTFIGQVIQTLPPQCKAVFQLSRNEEMSNKEIAESLGISVKAVEKHISKALKKLRRSLESYLKSLLLFSL
jgi:RNA polymerase sigma-70 factor (ECF subfamily)